MRLVFKRHVHPLPNDVFLFTLSPFLSFKTFKSLASSLVISLFYQVFCIQESTNHKVIHYFLWFEILLLQESDYYILWDDYQ